MPRPAIEHLQGQLTKEAKALEKARERVPELRRQVRIAMAEVRRHTANADDLVAAIAELQAPAEEDAA